jgi:replicative DNA helicase
MKLRVQTPVLQIIIIIIYIQTMTSAKEKINLRSRRKKYSRGLGNSLNKSKEFVFKAHAS